MQRQKMESSLYHGICVARLALFHSSWASLVTKDRNGWFQLTTFLFFGIREQRVTLDLSVYRFGVFQQLMCPSSPFRTCTRCGACSTVLLTLINFRKASSAVFDKLLRYELIMRMDERRGRMCLNPYLQGSKHQKILTSGKHKIRKKALVPRIEQDYHTYRRCSYFADWHRSY